MRHVLRVFLMMVLAGALGASRQAPASPPVQPAPVNFTRSNLQVLPADLPVRDLVALMRSFSLGLDVDCQHCHVGEGRDLSKFDFASDAKPSKTVARQMLQLVAVINQRVAPIGQPAPAGEPKVTCFTCHRGARKPLTRAPGGQP
jgi:hypothetical protein